nr:unnamed protein product [Callosobruchus analis]
MKPVVFRTVHGLADQKLPQKNDMTLAILLNVQQNAHRSKIGATVAEYSHILSFRRQVYIAPLDTDTLPESIEINHDGLSYRIFMTLDSQKCYKCNLTGHIASQCRSTHNAPTTSHSHIQESQQSTPEIQPHQNIQTSSSEHTILSQSATNDIALAKEDIDTTRSTQKIPNPEPATTDLSTSSKTSNKRSFE